MVRVRFLSLTLIGVLSLGEAVAIAGQSRVPELEAARRAYWEGRFDQSIEQLNPLLDKLDDQAALREAAFLLGLNYLALGDEARGREYFSSAVRYDPAFLPSEELYTRDIVRTYMNIRSDSVGRLVVTSEPAGARVFVAGRAMGTTPYEGDVAAGEQSIKAELKGYTGQVRRVRITPGKRASVTFELSREVASVGDDKPAEFQKIKLLGQEGEKTKETDAILVLENNRIVVRTRKGGLELKTLAYRNIKSAEYSYSRHPRWKEGLGAAVAVGVFAAPIFFLKGKKHWLTLQTEDDYAILRLDKNNYELICLSFNARAGIDVEVLGEK